MITSKFVDFQRQSLLEKYNVLTAALLSKFPNVKLCYVLVGMCGWKTNIVAMVLYYFGSITFLNIKPARVSDKTQTVKISF